MSIVSEKTAKLIDSLPPEKAQALLEYATFLAEKADEEAWEKRFSNPVNAPKLKAMADQALAELNPGQAEPLDPDRM